MLAVDLPYGQRWLFAIIQRLNWDSDSSTYWATVRGARFAARRLIAHEPIRSSSVATDFHLPVPVACLGCDLQRTPIHRAAFLSEVKSCAVETLRRTNFRSVPPLNRGFTGL